MLRMLPPLRRQVPVVVLVVREEFLQEGTRRLTLQQRPLLVPVGGVDLKGARGWQLSNKPRGRAGYSEHDPSTRWSPEPRL